MTTTQPVPMPITAAPPVLLGYQRRWIDDPAPLKIAEKGRRVGLTWAEAADNVLSAAAATGSNTFYISATQDMALEYIEACAMWAKVFNQAASEIQDEILRDEDKDIKTYKIDFPSTGRRIVALSSRPTNLRGKQGVIVVDESAYHPSLHKMIKAAMAMLLWGDRVRIISTHDGVENPFFELVEEVRGGKRKGSVHRIPFRDAVEEGLYRRVCIRRGIVWTAERERQWVADAYDFYGDAAAEELDVIPSRSGGAYLPIGLIEARMSSATPVVRHRWPEDYAYRYDDRARALETAEWCEAHLLPILGSLDSRRPHGMGEDFGRSGDLTVLDVLEEGSDLVLRLRLRVELSRAPFTTQEQIVRYILSRLPQLRAAAFDARGNGQFLAERTAQHFGERVVHQIMLSSSFYLDNFPRLKYALQDGSLEGIPQDAEARDDLRAIKMVSGIPRIPERATQAADEDKSQRHGDSAISLLLAYYAMRQTPVEIDYTPAPAAGLRRQSLALDDDLVHDRFDDYQQHNTDTWGAW